jgi:hypothetical protein
MGMGDILITLDYFHNINNIKMTILNQDAFQAAQQEYATVLFKGIAHRQLSKLAIDALEATILKYLMEDDRLADILDTA